MRALIQLSVFIAIFALVFGCALTGKFVQGRMM